MVEQQAVGILGQPAGIAALTGGRHRQVAAAPCLDRGRECRAGSEQRDRAGECGARQKTAPVHMIPSDLFVCLILQLHAGGRIELSLPDGHSTSVFVLKGRVVVNGAEAAGEAELAVLKRHGSLVALEAKEDSRLLIMSGKPIDEPIARYGPFVMNTKAELIQAVEDYQAGRMGHLS